MLALLETRTTSGVTWEASSRRGATVPGRQVGAALTLAILFAAVIVIFTAWYAAKKLLSPKDIFGISDKQISRLGFFRSFAGLLTIVVTTLPFRGASRVIAGSIFHIVEAIAIGVIAVIACIIFAVMITPSRRELVARTWRPLSKMVMTFGSLIAGDALGHLPMVSRLLNMKHPPAAAFVSIAGLLILLAFWLLLFALWALYYSARYLYCPGEVHPLLAPLVTIVAVTIITAMEIARANRWFGGLETLFGKVVGQPKPAFLAHPAPQGLILALTLFGWLSTVILAGFEWRSISMKGVSLRKVLPTRRDASPTPTPGTPASSH
jgi:hypothetical protein